MERRNFIKNCCLTAVGVPVAASLFQSCKVIYYATATRDENRLIIKKTDFYSIKADKSVKRKFVLVKNGGLNFPICVYNVKNEEYIASLMECTHRSCELNIGGGVYSCPCHGSEFSIQGEVLEGPADTNLKTFKTEVTDDEIYIYLA